MDDRVHGRKGKMEAFPRGFGPPGFRRTKRVPLNGGLDLEARAGLFVPIGNDDRSHHGTALLDDGLRKRGAGVAAVMLEGPDHWNEMHAAHCSLCAKRKFNYDGGRVCAAE
jgi:hypothetical protein